MSNVSHIFASRVAPRWTTCEVRCANAIASFENGATKDGIAHLCHALVANDRPSDVDLRRLFREVTEAAGAFDPQDP